MHRFSDKHIEQMNRVFGHMDIWRDWLKGNFRAHIKLSDYYDHHRRVLETLTPAGRELLMLMHAEFFHKGFRKPIDRVKVAELLQRQRISDWDRQLLNTLVAQGWLQAERKANTSKRERITGRWVGRGARWVYTMSDGIGLVLVFIRQFREFPEYQADDEDWEPEPEPEPPSIEEILGPRPDRNKEPGAYYKWIDNYMSLAEKRSGHPTPS